MDKERILIYCASLKNAIDWEYECSSDYQAMCRKLDRYVNYIIEDCLDDGTAKANRIKKAMEEVK
jgi:hypothetical protein